MVDERYRPLEEMLEMIDGTNKPKCYRLLEENRELLSEARGSKSKHQAWKGGYLDHLVETMNLALVFYDVLDSRRKLGFLVSDALLVLFLHDIEKPWKQLRNSECHLESNSGVKDDSAIEDFKEETIGKYGFELSEQQRNALKYVEGEVRNYDPHQRLAGELAAFCHLCDWWSARGWHDFPKENDPWDGAKRSKNS